MMSFLKITVLFTALVATVSSFAQQAPPPAPVLYEAAFVVPWKYINEVVNSSAQNTPVEFKETKNNFTVTAQGVPVVIPKIDFTVKTKLKPVTSNGADNVWESSSLQAKIDVSPVSVSKQVTEERDGYTVIITLKADCSAFTLTQSEASLKARWAWAEVNGDVRPQISQLNINWSPSTWKIQGLKCVGPSGFANLVEQEIRQQLSNVDALNQLADSKIRDYLDTKATEQLAQWKNPRWVENGKNKLIKFFLNKSSLAPGQGIVYSILVRAGKEVEAPTENDGSTIVPFTPPNDIVQKITDKPTMIVPSQAMAHLVQDIALQQTQVKDLNKDVPAFQKLLNSRFNQTFYWPDLKNYSKTSQFKNITRVLDADILIAKHEQVRIKATLYSWIYSQREGKTWNYVEIKNKINMLTHIAIYDGGVFELAIARYESEPTLKYGADYAAYFRPSGFLSSSIPEYTSTKAGLSMVNYYQLPDMKVSDSLTLRSKAMSRPRSDIFILPWAKVP